LCTRSAAAPILEREVHLNESTEFTGHAGLRPMLGLALLSYCLLIVFPGEPAPATQSAAAAPTPAAAASSAAVEPKPMARRA
jgi:hypothetical protein